MIPKRGKILGEINDLVGLDKSPASLTKLSTTRWTVRATGFQQNIDNYDHIVSYGVFV